MEPRTTLRGRDAECAVLDRTLDAARSGQSGAVVVRGEPGIGKTALLEYAVASADDMQVLRSAGVESEIELAFGGLQQLCAPLLDRLGELPGPQRDALGVAFGLADGDAPDRFLVGLAALSLLAGAAEDRPLLCVVDDAQWLDGESVRAIAFVARRLLAEPVAVVVVTREPSQALKGLSELVLTGLGAEDARALLASGVVGLVDRQVRDRFIAETHGNPLALVELPREVSPQGLMGGYNVPEHASLVDRLERSFVQRLESLRAETRRLLLVAAAEPVGDPALLWRACASLGLPPDAADPAQTAGLIDVGARVHFRHPLVRSAIYGSASPAERRVVHAALANATDPAADPDRRAWHQAQATSGPDEDVAGELVRSAARARSRGGTIAAAAFLARAAELTPDTARRGARALAAAQAKFEAAAPEAAADLLALAEMSPLDPRERATLTRLRAEIVFARRRGSDAPPLLLEAAKQFETLDVGLARETYLEALGAAIFAGRAGVAGGVADAAAAALAAPRNAGQPRASDALLDGLTKRFTEPFERATPLLTRALHAFADGAGEPEQAEQVRWLWTACPVTPEPLAAELWDDEAWEELSTRAVALAREAGALAVLPIALTYRACVHLHAGELAAAAAMIDEANAITAATGNAPLPYTSLMLLAWRGEEEPAQTGIEAALAEAEARGEGRAIGLAHYATAVLYNGLGQYGTGFAAAERACEDEDLGFFGWALLELIEAGARCGEHAAARVAVAVLEERTVTSGTEWALGNLARSRALISDGDDADALYREAIERLGRTRIAVHRARAQLLYGEWLRRRRRRADARAQLREAFDAFAAFGAVAFRNRAHRELRATGETVRGRDRALRDELTSQEAQIAKLARDGLSNPEIGAQLFISPRTVQYHLRKVFAKLDIDSRRQLGGVPAERFAPV